MKTILKRFKKISKTLLTILLSSNLILLSTGSAELNLATESASVDQSNQSAELATSSAEVEGQTTTSTNQTAPPLKIDPTGRFIEDELIIKFKEGFPEQSQEGILKALNATPTREDLNLGGAKTLKVDPSSREKVREKVMEALKNNPNVLYVELNHVGKIEEGGGGEVPTNSPSSPGDYFYRLGAQWGLQRIKAPEAWQYKNGNSFTGGIAVLDTGIDYTHQDLGVWPYGRVVKGRDLWNNDSDPMDDNGHGTSVAGILGAVTNNVIDIAAVDWYSKIVAIKTHGASGDTTVNIVAAGIRDAADCVPVCVKVINLSSRFPDHTVTLKDAVDYAIGKGVRIVAAVNNSTTTNCFMGFPAAYYGVISVAATTVTSESVPQDIWFSGCTGNVKDGVTWSQLQITAPGHLIYTLMKGNLTGYQTGTSFAAPFVAGSVSILSTCTSTPYLDLIQGVDDVGPAGWDSSFGYGRLNLFKALDRTCI